MAIMSTEYKSNQRKYNANNNNTGKIYIATVVNWLSTRKQRIVIIGTASDWESVTSGVPPDSVLGPVVFIMYINDINVGLNNRISEFADDTKIRNSIITDHDRMSHQQDLRNISEWSQTWKNAFNANKCHILQVRTRNQKFDYEMNGTKLQSVQCVKALGVTIASSLKFSQQCKDAAGKANRMLGFYKQKFLFLKVKTYFYHCIST